MISARVRHDSDSLQTVDTMTPCLCLFSSEVHLRAVADKWSSIHTSLSLPKHSGAVVLMFFWSTNTHFINRCHRQADSLLSIHTASGFIDSEGERVCFYKQHIGVLLKDTSNSLLINQSLLCSQNVLQYKMHLRLCRCIPKNSELCTFWKHAYLNINKEQWRHNGYLCYYGDYML